MKGRNGAWTARGKEGRKEANGGWIERGREGAWEQGREGNFTGGSIFTNQPFTNRPLPLRLWCYKCQIANMYKLLTLCREPERSRVTGILYLFTPSLTECSESFE